VPVLSHPVNPATIALPSRKASIIAETDVLVVGGGPAGLGAAVGAAEAGTDVILAERYGFLGGNATAALVTYFMSFYIQSRDSKANVPQSIYPPMEPIIAGVVQKYLNLILELGGAVPPSPETGYIIHFDPEIFKLVAEKILDQYQVQFLFHSFASGVIGGSNQIEGVIFETKSGPLVIKAKVIIDCTGDGDIAAYAGAPYKIGRESDGLVQPMTLMFRVVEFNRSRFEAYGKDHPGQWRGVHGLWDLIQKATQEGKLNLPREDMLFFGSPHEKEINVDSTRITGVLGLDVWDLTRAEYEGRRQVQQIARFLKEYVPGFEESYVVQTGVEVGVRETRRITGEYTLTVDDILEAHKFEDIVARGSYPVDIHNPKGSGTILKHLAPGESYDIPLRCLIPQKVDNLLTAGRCISGTSEALASYRIMPISMATGQAAGVCAALSINHKKKPRNMAYQSIQKELLRQGANLRGIKG
jgi:hypothetical protein